MDSRPRCQHTFDAKEIEFKFFIRDKRLDYKPLWEAYGNRTIELTDIKDGDVVVYCLPECGFDIYPLKLAGTQVRSSHCEARRALVSATSEI